MSRPPKDQELVVAYGFDQVGLRIPSPVERPEYRIEFVQYGSSELGTNAGGIIFPTGIFEHVEYHNTPLGGRRAKVSCDRPILLGVERHVTNLLRAGGWIVILAREIVDEFPTGDGYRTFVSDETDLAKRLLSGVKRLRYPEGSGGVFGTTGGGSYSGGMHVEERPVIYNRNSIFPCLRPTKPSESY